MFVRLKSLQNSYPRQFWLLFWGLLISTIGSSMIWPFLLIYVSHRLNLPLTVSASLMTINAAAAVAAALTAGPILDRFGRKWVMVVSLGMVGVSYIFLASAETYIAFAVVMAMSGAFTPLYRVGADAMMADLIPSEKRMDAYSLLRMSNNIGVSLGPAIGGWIATASYSIAFYIAATGMSIYGLIITFLAKETLSSEIKAQVALTKERFGGYGKIFRDREFMLFIGIFILNQVVAALLWVIMPVYANTNFHVPENLYGLIPTTNALMVVFLQLWVTKKTKRHSPYLVLAVGAAFYAVGVGSVALSWGFYGFLMAMVIATVGELVMTPTATTLVATLAPSDMRGRYMSIYSLTWNVASGIGPLMGGFLGDTLGPKSTWIGGLVIGLVSILGFVVIRRMGGSQAHEAEAAIIGQTE
ncbi:MAG: MDR family MFS transporter [Anaerolineaceae bacterium]